MSHERPQAGVTRALAKALAVAGRRRSAWRVRRRAAGRRGAATVTARTRRATIDPSERTVPAQPPGRDPGGGAARCWRAALSRSPSRPSTSCLQANTQLLGLGDRRSRWPAGRRRRSWPASWWCRRRPRVEERGPLLDEEAAEEVVEMVESGGEGISRRGLLTGAGGRGRARLLTAAATPLASLGPTLERRCTRRRGAAACGCVDDERPPYAGRRHPDRLLLHRAARARRPRAASAPGCSSSGCRAEFIHLPADRARLGARGDPRLLQDLPSRRVRDLAVPLSRLRADQPRARRSPARATTRRSCPARAAG